MDKSGMLQAIISHVTNGNKAQFAKILGVSAQTISAWISRNTYDAECIYTKCRYISPSWLLTGEGEMLRNEGDEKALCPQNTKDAPIIDHLLDTIREQAEEIGRLKARIEELERSRGDDAGHARSSGIADVG